MNKTALDPSSETEKVHYYFHFFPLIISYVFLFCDLTIFLFHSDSGGSYGDLNDLDNLLVSIKDFDITAENIRKFLPKVNWEQLASMYVVGRSGAECEVRYALFYHCSSIIDVIFIGILHSDFLVYLLQDYGIQFQNCSVESLFYSLKMFGRKS